MKRKLVLLVLAGLLLGSGVYAECNPLNEMGRILAEGTSPPTGG